MTQVQTAEPIRYSPALEHPEAEEAKSAATLRDTLHSIMETTSKDYAHAVRAVHAKSHGLVHGTLDIPADLPPLLAQGLFAAPGQYKATLRFSTSPGDILEDGVSSPRGVGIKIVGVQGDRLAGSEGEATQDFIMVNGPTFNAPSVEKFAGSLKLLASTTDKAEGLKQVLSTVLQAAEGALEAVGGKSGLLTALGGAPNTHPLGDTYFSQTPFRYGDNIAKFSLLPLTTNLTEVKDAKIVTTDRPDALREDIGEVFIEGDSQWALRVQFCTDADKMPIEDSTVEWSEEDSPWHTVATLTVPRQASWSGADTIAEEDRLAFSVWHGLEAHRPLGSINRARQAAYDMSAEFRGKFNGCPITEPTD